MLQSTKQSEEQVTGNRVGKIYLLIRPCQYSAASPQDIVKWFFQLMFNWPVLTGQIKHSHVGSCWGGGVYCNKCCKYSWAQL